MLYDYVVELGKELVGDSKDYLQDSDLFRDDAKILLGNLYIHCSYQLISNMCYVLVSDIHVHVHMYM